MPRCFLLSFLVLPALLVSSSSLRPCLHPCFCRLLWSWPPQSSCVCVCWCMRSSPVFTVLDTPLCSARRSSPSVCARVCWLPFTFRSGALSPFFSRLRVCGHWRLRLRIPHGFPSFLSPSLPLGTGLVCARVCACACLCVPAVCTLLSSPPPSLRGVAMADTQLPLSSFLCVCVWRVLMGLTSPSHHYILFLHPPFTLQGAFFKSFVHVLWFDAVHFLVLDPPPLFFSSPSSTSLNPHYPLHLHVDSSSPLREHLLSLRLSLSWPHPPPHPRPLPRHHLHACAFWCLYACSCVCVCAISCELFLSCRCACR